MSMDAVQARKIVLVSVMGLLIIATYRGKSGKVATSTRLWGTGWVAVMLGIAADFAPTVAGPFALLVLVGSLTNGGDAAFLNLLGRAGAGTDTGVPARFKDTLAGPTSAPTPVRPPNPSNTRPPGAVGPTGGKTK